MEEVMDTNTATMAEQEPAYKRKARKRGKNRKVRVEFVWQMDNLIQAHNAAKKRKGSQRGVQRFEKRKEARLPEIKAMLERGEYHTSPGVEVDQKCPCGKVRRLHKVPYDPDHIVHHAHMQVVNPVMQNAFYYDSSASVEGKGIHFAAKRARKWIDKNKSCGTIRFVKLDFVKHYHNINQEKCYQSLAQKFGDKGIRQLFHEIVTICDEGLGIGLYPIQPISNFYTSKPCREVMEQFNVFVMIYCDDVVILGTDKKEIWKAVNYFKWYAENVMEQKLHDNIGMQVIDERHGLDFVGYRYYIDRTFLRKRMKVKFKRKMARLTNPGRRYRVAVSYKGWMQHCDGLTLWRSVMGLKSFKDLHVPKFEKVDGNGKRIIDGTKVAIGMLTERSLEFTDVELGLRSKFDKPAAVVQVKDDSGKLFKFFTSSPRLLQIFQYVKEKDALPFSGRIVNRNTSGYPDYDIDD